MFLLRPDFIFSKKVLAIMAILVAVGGIYIYFGTQASNPRQIAKTFSVGKRGEAEKLTLELIGSAKELKNNPANPDKAKALRDIADRRKQIMKDLITTDPKAALENAISDNVVADLPEVAKSQIERRITLKGKIDVLHAHGLDSDKPDELASTFTSYLDAAGVKTQLHFASGDVTEFAGAEVSATGVKLDDQMAVDATTNTATFTADPIPVPAVGTSTTYKIAVVVFNNKGYSSRYSPATLKSLFAGPINSYFKETSFGKVNLSVSAFGAYSISSCDINEIASIARSKAGSGYDRYVSYLPMSPCNFIGYSQGGQGQMPGSNLWFYSLDTKYVGLFAHELGHTFGAHHSNRPPGAPTGEYKDGYDIMGPLGLSGVGQYLPFHLNSYQKGRVGFLAPNQTVTVTASGKYELFPIEGEADNVKTVRVPIGNGKYYYIEYRKPIGFDAKLPTSEGVFGGVSIRTAPGYGSIAMPELVRASLKPGETFNGANNIEIKTTCVNNDTNCPNSAKVQVTLPPAPCVRANPRVNVTPNSKTAEKLGDELSYSVTFTNTDSATCPDAQFNLNSPDVKRNGITILSTSLGATSFSDVRPGGTRTTTLKVKSNNSTPAGPNTFGVVARRGATNYVGSDNGVYVTPDLTAPSVYISSPKDGDTITRPVKITASAQDNVGIRRFELLIDGQLVATTNTGSIDYGWNVNGVSAGSHTITVKAWDTSGNESLPKTITVKIGEKGGKKNR